MTLRRLTVAMMVAGGLCIWGFAHSSDKPAPSADPLQVEAGEGEGGTHDDAVARFRGNQSRHWRHVAIGMRGTCP
jgi:hypothetical protein